MHVVRFKGGPAGPLSLGCLVPLAFAVSEAWSIGCAISTGLNTGFGDSRERTILAGLYGLLCVVVLLPAGWAAMLWDGWKARMVSVAAIAAIGAIALKAAGAIGLTPASLLILGMPAWTLLIAIVIVIERRRGL